LINPQTMMLGQEPRQTTSNLGHLNKPSIQALIHGLNRHYYSIAISYRKNELEERMLMNLQKKAWTAGLMLKCAACARHRPSRGPLCDMGLARRRHGCLLH
jgi:26S proteasome regulatory subunit N11